MGDNEVGGGLSLISNINKPDDDEAWEGRGVTVWALASLLGPPWEQENQAALQSDRGGGRHFFSAQPTLEIPTLIFTFFIFIFSVLIKIFSRPVPTY